MEWFWRAYVDITVLDVPTRSLICRSIAPSRPASTDPSSRSCLTPAAFPPSAVFMASRNALAFWGLMARRIGPRSLRSAPRSPASCVCDTSMTAPSV